MRKIAPKSGETLVEILAAAAIFLLMMGIMQGAISFCTNAQHKSAAIRSVNAEICRKLRVTTPASAGGAATYSFRAISLDGTQQSGVLFEVETDLGKKDVTYRDEAGVERTVTFYLFQSTIPNAGGGAGP